MPPHETTELEVLLARIDERTQNTDQFVRDYTARTDKRLDENERCIGELKVQQARIGERMTIAHGLQAAWSMVLAAIAAFVGSRQ